MQVSSQAPQTVVLYDGLCAVCSGSVRLLRRLDWRHRLEYVDVQDWVTVSARFPALDRDAALGQIHVIRPDGQVFVGYAGMRQLAGRLPLVAWLYPLLFLPGIRWLGLRVYRWVAARRYRLNRLFGRPICDTSTCKIPDVSGDRSSG